MRLNATRLGSIASSRSFGDQLYDLAGEVPPLDLNFADTKTLDPRVTHTRASSATYVDSSGVLRSAVTNLLLQSEDLLTTWTVNAGLSRTANQVVAPNGSTTADLLASDGTQVGYLEQSSASSNQFVSGTTYTYSIYLKKANTSTCVTLLFGITFNSGGGNPTAAWNLDTGIPTFTNGATGSMTAVGNGWYRCIMTDTATQTHTQNQQWVRMASASGDVYAWGAQLEQASTVGDYVPTTSTINSAPRFDHNPTTGESLGLLVEEARTNSVTNNTMVGAVAGTPGTLPTGWARSVTQNGITQNVAGVGVINGISYVDIRFQGTATGTGYTDVALGSATAAQNQSWAFSAYLALVEGSTANITAGALTLYGAPSFSDNGVVSWLSTIGSNLTANSRFSAVRTFTNATTNLANPRLTISATAGAAVDITLRIGMPQLELGAFATSVIPTTTATVTRAADVAQIAGSNFSSWYNQTEGTVFVEGAILNTGGNRFIADITDSGVNEEIGLYWGTGFNSLVSDNGVTQANSFGGTVTANSRTLHSFGYKLNDFQGYGNGTALATDTSGTLPTVDRLTIGSRTNSSFWTNGTIKRLTYFPTRLSNSTLQQITQP